MKVSLMILSLFLKTEAESMLPGLTLHMENEGQSCKKRQWPFL